jgi:hypothetical protein
MNEKQTRLMDLPKPYVPTISNADELEVLLPELLARTWGMGRASQGAYERAYPGGAEFVTGWNFACLYMVTQLGYRPGDLHDLTDPSNPSKLAAVERHLNAFFERYKNTAFHSTGDLVIPVPYPGAPLKPDITDDLRCATCQAVIRVGDSIEVHEVESGHEFVPETP